MTIKAPTQCDRILWILNDGAEHDAREFYGFCVLHSRISELRKRGHEIVYRRDGDKHLYRLVALREPDGGRRETPPSSGSRSAPLHERTDASPLGQAGAFAHGEGAALSPHLGRSLSDPDQLSLEAA